MGFTGVEVTGCSLIRAELDLAATFILDIGFNKALVTGFVSHSEPELLRQDLLEQESRNAFQFSCTCFVVSVRRP